MIMERPDIYVPKTLIVAPRPSDCENICDILWAKGFNVDRLQEKIPEEERPGIVNMFKDGRVRIMCATSLAAKALAGPVKDITAVVSFTQSPVTDEEVKTYYD